MTDQEHKPPRILVGGIPFGQNRIDHEGILECTVNLIREVRPDAEIWVITSDQKSTEKKLDVSTRPSIGSNPSEIDKEAALQAVSESDAVICAGGTPLSDNPELSLELLDQASNQNKFTAIFCVGMNAEVKTASSFSTSRGQGMFSSIVRVISLGIVDLAREQKANEARQIRERLQHIVPTVNLVVAGDSNSQTELGKFLPLETLPEVGANLLINLPCYDIDACRFPETTKRFLDLQGPLIGLTGSSITDNQDQDALLDTCNQLIKSEGAKVLGIPFHPKAETPNLVAFRSRLDKPESMHVIEGIYEPDEITAAIGRLDVIVSDQLSPVVLASNTLTPFVGLGDNLSLKTFAQRFDLPKQPSMSSSDPTSIQAEIRDLIQNRAEFRHLAKRVRCEMLQQLSQAKGQLRDAITDL